jgi:thiol:disulfide interchange protein DsbD
MQKGNPMRRPLLALIAFAALCAPLLVGAQTPSSPIATAQLVVDAPVVKRGKSVSAGVTITLPEHWHIYWKNPGDSGIVTSLEWTLPEGITAGEIEWPAPERIEMQGLVNYGYSNIVTLPVSLTPMRDDVVGEVKVKASWLVCKDICIPESVELTAMLNGNADAAKIIAAARAQVPQPFTGNASFDAAPDAVTLTITRDNPWGADDVLFSPANDGIMANYPYGSFKQVGNELTLTMPRGSADVPAQWQGVLHVMKAGKEEAWDITAKNSGVATATTQPITAEPVPTNNTPVRAAPTAFTTALMLAFLGGLILNIMPCVLPILALKALALSKKAAASRVAAAKQGFSYTAGVVASFLLIAAAMLVLKATGSAIGWGFQLQNPAFVAFLVVVMLLVSANLLGLFELPTLFGAKATGVNEDKLSGSFLTGVLAVLVATPCTAPFMATAVGATLSLPTAQALVVFAALGLGMASPFLIISLWPAARRLLPKPGAWMHRFKQILAIPMLATAAWLVWVLVQILNPTPIVKTDLTEAYSAERLGQLRAEGKPVFVDATAAWCISCKVNEHMALKPAEMQRLFRDKNITILIADWTNSDPEITKYLAQFNRNGVPLYVYYAPNAEPVVLPQVLTPSIVREAIEAAR